MVRLKQNLSENFKMMFIFQFHYGTIKTAIVEKLSNEIVLFQFHYGTIKTVFVSLE